MLRRDSKYYRNKFAVVVEKDIGEEKIDFNENEFARALEGAFNQRNTSQIEVRNHAFEQCFIDITKIVSQEAYRYNYTSFENGNEAHMNIKLNCANDKMLFTTYAQAIYFEEEVAYIKGSIAKIDERISNPQNHISAAAKEKLVARKNFFSRELIITESLLEEKKNDFYAAQENFSADFSNNPSFIGIGREMAASSKTANEIELEKEKVRIFKLNAIVEAAEIFTKQTIKAMDINPFIVGKPLKTSVIAENEKFLYECATATVKEKFKEQTIELHTRQIV
jgi:hypothetical protein